MLTKIRTNFNKVNVASKILLVVAYVLAMWKEFAAVLTAYLGNAQWVMVLFGCSISGAVVAVIAHFIAKLYLRMTRLHTVPVREFSLFSTLAYTLYYVLLALLNLIILVAPTFLVWGSVIFPVVSALASGAAFYLVTSKLYFNDVTRAYYFKTMAIFVIALTVMAGGILTV